MQTRRCRSRARSRPARRRRIVCGWSSQGVQIGVQMRTLASLLRESGAGKHGLDFGGPPLEGGAPATPEREAVAMPRIPARSGVAGAPPSIPAGIDFQAAMIFGNRFSSKKRAIQIARSRIVLIAVGFLLPCGNPMS